MFWHIFDCPFNCSALLIFYDQKKKIFKKMDYKTLYLKFTSKSVISLKLHSSTLFSTKNLTKIVTISNF